MTTEANVAVVGYGLAGNSFHSYLVSLADGLNLYGVMARRPEVREQAGADWGVKTYAALDDMLADDAIDLVVVATPHDTHAGIAIAAMNAGKHCVVDKIMCLNIADVLLNGAELAVKPEEVRKMIVLTEACAKSAATGQTVPVSRD